jgi:hypothetical protein
MGRFAVADISVSKRQQHGNLFGFHIIENACVMHLIIFWKAKLI